MSSNNIYSGAILTLIVLLASVGFATALSEDFTAVSPQTAISLCACDLATSSIAVLNTGETTSVYSLSQEGSASGWSTAAPETFILERGEKKTITQFVDVPCNARGDYTLTTKITTLFDLRKDLTQTAHVKNCPNVEITPIGSATFETCPCSPGQYQFEIKNTRGHTETYKIYVSMPADINANSVTLSDDVLVLNPNERKTVYVFTNLDCGSYGNKTFSLNVLATGSQILGQASFGARIVKCYDFALSALSAGKKTAVACKGFNNTIPVTIKSQSSIANDYHAGVVGPSWITIPEQDLFLYGGEQGTINLLARPDATANKTTQIIIDATTKRGNEYRALDLTVEPQDCYNNEFVFEISALAQTKCQPKEHGVLLVNTGTKPTRVHIDLVAPEWMSLAGVPNDGTGYVKLAPQQQMEFAIKSEPPCDFEGQQYIDLVASYADIEKEPTTQTSVLRVLPAEQAYKISADLSRVSINYEKRVTPVTITHEGTEKSTYELELAASKWMKLDASFVTLGPGETTIVNLITEPDTSIQQDTYKATIIAHTLGKDTNYNNNYNNEFLVQLYKNKYYEMLHTSWNYYGFSLIIGVPVFVLLLFFITTLRSKRKKQADKKQPTLDEFDAEGTDNEEWKKIFNQKPRKKKNLLFIFLAWVLLFVVPIIGTYFAFVHFPILMNNFEQVSQEFSQENSLVDTTTPNSTSENSISETTLDSTIFNQFKNQFNNSILLIIGVVLFIIVCCLLLIFLHNREKQTKLNYTFKKIASKESDEDIERIQTTKRALPAKLTTKHRKPPQKTIKKNNKSRKKPLKAKEQK
ncbi:hypothetical protein HY772_04520 [Candidatus Woesearchaeota archaeon]|nr:hypothetical protein [Candidatus Woesearchaeota archaeon]